MLAAANEAASQINVGDMESRIQAQLQAKIDAGASQSDLLAEVSAEDVVVNTPGQMPVPTNPVLPVSPFQGGSASGPKNLASDVSVPTPTKMPVPTNPILPASPFQGGPATGPSNLNQDVSVHTPSQMPVPTNPVLPVSPF